MTVREHAARTPLYRLLAATRLYPLAGDNPVDWELEAYLAGFALVEERCRRAWEDLFLQTCGQERLRQWERLLDLPHHPAAPLEARRQTVLLRLAVGPKDSTRSGIHRSLRAAGMEAEVTEDTAAGTLSVRLLDLGSHNSASAAALEGQKMMPAHLEVIFELGGPGWDDHYLWNKTWEYTEALEMDWAAWETAVLE